MTLGESNKLLHFPTIGGVPCGPMGVHGPPSYRVHVASGKRFDVSAPGRLEGKNLRPHDPRNPDI
jgi:hypothetical protein